jgi:hypothetical protein
MTRITDRFVVQRVDGMLVFVDDSTGAEVTLPVEHTALLIGALRYLADPEGANPVPILDIHADDQETEAARYAAAVEEWHTRRNQW